MSIRKTRVFLLRVSFLPILFVVLFVRPSWGRGSSIAFWMELSGYVFLLGGLAMRIWSILYIGGRKSHKLVTDGPYSLCRNPLYVGTFLLAVGVGLCFENVVMLALVPALIIPVHVLVVLQEERHLEALFPEPFAAYKREVPRFWPRLAGYHSPKELTVPVRSIGRVLIDTIGILLLPEAEDFLELLHVQGILPVLWHFPS